MVEQVDAVVLGMGPGGEEVAGRLARFGSEVSIVEGARHLRPAEEPEAGQLLVATGRRADLAAIGAGSIGLDEKVRSSWWKTRSAASSSGRRPPARAEARFSRC